MSLLSRGLERGRASAVASGGREQTPKHVVILAVLRYEGEARREFVVSQP